MAVRRSVVTIAVAVGLVVLAGGYAILGQKQHTVGNKWDWEAKFLMWFLHEEVRLAVYDGKADDMGRVVAKLSGRPIGFSELVGRLKEAGVLPEDANDELERGYGVSTDRAGNTVDAMGRTYMCLISRVAQETDGTAVYTMRIWTDSLLPVERWELRPARMWSFEFAVGE